MAKQPRTLAGHVVAITGAARGIGRATAATLAREGMTVAIGDLDAALAGRAAEELGPHTAAFQVDVTDRESFERFIDGVEAQLGPVDVLVNNAGIMPVGPFLAEDDETARRMVDVNVHGVLLGMKIVLPRLVARRSGHVVNVASFAGKAPFPGGATYCGTKHFVVGLSETVRGELRGSGVDLSVVMPVVVDTELASGVGTARGVPRLTPEGVAEAIADALRHPRFDIFVPRPLGPLNAIAQLLPRALRERTYRAIKADRVLADVDTGARRGYELRAARSDPGLEPPPEPRFSEAG
jgi:NADP-dependent 3-hydroxy acid dehydrogenase YdfG